MRMRYFVAVFVCFFLSAAPAHASLMSYVSDLIYNSAPNASTNHRIRFTIPQAIPASGTIVITPEVGAYSLPADFDYLDVDFSVWNGSAYIDRSLAVTASPTEDGVSINLTSGVITLTLSSVAGLPAGSQVEVRLGTNASEGGAGVHQPINPSQVTSYRIGIRTYDAGGAAQDLAWAMIAVVYPVTIEVPLENTPPTVSNGLPSGALVANNSTIELTFETDRTATCRYSMTPGVAYASMTDSFSTANGVFFYKVISGHTNNTTYNYYIKCRGVQGAISPDDYVISFSLEPDPISNTSVSQSGGTVGSGDFVNGSQVLYQAVVTLIGKTSPNATLVVLKDGAQVMSAQAGSTGSFQVVVPSLERGTYSFSVYARDSKQRKSASYTSTLALVQGTNNILSGILLPPTLGLEKDTISLGEAARALGETFPGGKVDLVVSPQSTGGTAKQLTATTSSTGLWSIDIDANSLTAGSWGLKARVTTGQSQSDYGTPVFLGVGKSPGKNPGLRADINKDGKVNLVDFSIMLSFWNTDNALADINEDGIVNLADFSIMLFNWTG